MKNIIIANKQGKAVAVGDNNFTAIKKTGIGNFSASLEVLKEIMSAIPTEPSETVCIYLPDMIQGIVTGSAVEYVKNGKTGSGNELTPDEQSGFAEFYKMYADRILNVKFARERFIKKDDAVLKNIRANAWNLVDTFSGAIVNSQPVVIDPNEELKKMLDAQILEALKTGNMEMVTNLTTYKNSLPAPTVVAGTSSGVATAGTIVAAPNFDDEADKAFGGNNTSQETSDNENIADENGNPIVFDEVQEGAAQQPW